MFWDQRVPGGAGDPSATADEVGLSALDALWMLRELFRTLRVTQGVQSMIQIVQGVVVFAVTVSPRGVVDVDLIGGRSNVCGSVRFLFDDRREQRSNVQQLRHWQRSHTPLTFVSNGQTVTLQDDDMVFGPQLDRAPT